MLEAAAAWRKANTEQLLSSKESLSSKEIDELAEKLYWKYDPKRMSQAEYNGFINDLVNAGALNRAETECMCMDGRVYVDPTAPGGLVQVRPGERMICSLVDANGNVELFLEILKKRYNSGTQADEARVNAIRKAAAVLDAIIKMREKNGL